MENAGRNANASGELGPFDNTMAWPSGYVRLRFTTNTEGTTPAANPFVQLIEYYMPIEFTVSTMGTDVTTNVGNGSAVASHMECGTLAELPCDKN